MMMGKRQCGGTRRWWALALAAALAAAMLPARPVALRAQTVVTTDLQAASKSKKEVNIEADSMEVLDKQKKAIFTGKVDAKREDVTLHADKLVVDYADSKQKDGTTKTDVTFLDATGHVVIITSKQHISGDWAKMDVRANQLTVGGAVTVSQDKTVIKGKKLFVDLDKNISKMSGGRVTGSFVPSGQ